MKKLLLLSMLMFFFTSGYNMHADTYIPSKKELAANKLIIETAETLAKRHNMFAVGEGGRMLFEIEILSLSFRVDRYLTKEEGRLIAVDCVEEFLKNINKDERIRPYLKNYPFTPKNVSILLFMFDEKGYGACHPNIGVVDASHEKIIYKTDERGKPGYKETYEESYQDALKLVQGTSF